MKNFKSVLATISLIVLSGTCLTLGQSSPKNFYISSRVSFDSLTENIELKLPVVQHESLSVVIRSNIYEGELSIEFYDSKGEKQGNFSIGSQLLSAKQDTAKKRSRESVTGEISRLFNNPAKGEWKIKIIPRMASGFLDIRSSQYSVRKK